MTASDQRNAEYGRWKINGSSFWTPCELCDGSVTVTFNREFPDDYIRRALAEIMAEHQRECVARNPAYISTEELSGI
jgi:uncharacterized protein CbrC (UPF0167 family)